MCRIGLYMVLTGKKRSNRSQSQSLASTNDVTGGRETLVKLGFHQIFELIFQYEARVAEKF